LYRFVGQANQGNETLTSERSMNGALFDEYMKAREALRLANARAGAVLQLLVAGRLPMSEALAEANQVAQAERALDVAERAYRHPESEAHHAG
jgi:hypothetical protein